MQDALAFPLLTMTCPATSLVLSSAQIRDNRAHIACKSQNYNKIFFNKAQLGLERLQ